MGRASSYRGARPLAVSSHSLLGAAPLFSPHRLSSSCRRYPLGVGGYAPTPCIDPVFFDSLCARYAQRCIICSRRGGSCARLAVRRCRAGRAVVCGVAARVGVVFVWRSARLRAWSCWQHTRVLLRGCYDARAGRHQGAHPGSTRMLLNERTIRHHRVNAGANKREKRKQGGAVTCR